MKLKSILIIALAIIGPYTKTQAQSGSFVTTGQKQYKLLETTSNSTWVPNQIIADASTVIDKIKNNDSFCLIATHHRSDVYDLSLPSEFIQYYFSTSIPVATINRSSNYKVLDRKYWENTLYSIGNNNPKYKLELITFKDLSQKELSFYLKGTGIDTINNPLNFNVYIIEDNVVASNGRTYNNVVRKMLGGPWGQNVTSQVLPNKTDSFSFVYNVPSGVNHLNLRFIAVATKWDSLSIGNREVVNCVESDFSRIFSNDTFFANSDSQCLNTNQFIFKDVSSYSDLYIRKWIFSNNLGDTATGSEAFKSYQTVGTHIVKLVRQYYYGYNDTIIKQIVVLPNPLAGSVAGANNNLLTGTPYLYNINQQNGMIYNWIVNNAAIVSGQGTNAIIVQWLSNGIGSLKCIVLNSLGCYDTSSLIVGIGNMPSIISFFPTSAGKDQTVLINGVNFAGTTAVKFGGVNAQSFNVVSSSQISALVGFGATGLVIIETPYGNAALQGFTFMSSTNASVLFTLSGVQIYPNPASTNITIDYGNFNAMSGYSLNIINSIGQTVFTTQINKQTSYIDLSSWTGKGIYFVQLIDPQNNTIENKKIMIE